MKVEGICGGAEVGPAVGDQVREMVVRARSIIADDVVHLTLEGLSAPIDAAWEPGAHIDLLLESDVVRQYSLCGNPADHGRFEIAVLREQNGRGGSALVHDRLGVGDRVTVRGPRNQFRLVTANRYLFIAGGIGITPILPMISAVARTNASWRLVYGGRSRASMAFAVELIARHGDRVTVWPQDEAGLLPLDDLLSDPVVGTAVYCCGPEPLLAAVEDVCRSRPQHALHVERFAPKPTAPSATNRAFNVELARSGRTVSVLGDANLLDVLTAEGAEIISSCGEGTCGTCETAVLGGMPDHRDSVLTDQERAENNVMMPCVSRCKSELLILDL